MFTLKGQICVSSYTQQSFKIKSPQAESCPMQVYASGRLFSRLAETVAANQFNNTRTCGSFVVSGRVLVSFKLGKKPAKEARDG